LYQNYGKSGTSHHVVFLCDALIYLVKIYKKLALHVCFMQNICCYPIDSSHLNVFTPSAGLSNILLQSGHGGVPKEEVQVKTGSKDIHT